jgi:hypothetical protein
MDEDIFERLKRQEQSIQEERQFYIHYEPTNGDIVNFRNYLEVSDSLPFIVVKETEMEVTLEQFERRDYLVLERDKVMKLVKVDTYSNNLFNIENLVYQIPRRTEITQDYEILVEQDNPNEIFRISLSDEMKEKFQTFRSVQRIMHLYVTAKDDPNILYKTLQFNVAEILSAPAIIPFDEFKGDSCNIYLTKYFQSYLHVDIR